jgi:hypothetical protein
VSELVPEADEYEGQGETIRDAANDAWEKAKRAGKEPGWYKVKTLYVLTENPVREYKVTITPGG